MNQALSFNYYFRHLETKWIILTGILFFIWAAGCKGPPGTNTDKIPLLKPGDWTYKGFQGGMYGEGQNSTPESHRQRGIEAARNIRKLNRSGNPDSSGHFVFMSVGMSNTSQEFCNPVPSEPLQCRGSETFIPRARADQAVNHEGLEIINGAHKGHFIEQWDSPRDTIYRWIRENLLQPRNLSEEQVQVIWLKNANGNSPERPTLKDDSADAYVLLKKLGQTIRALKTRYPNLRQVLVSSRTYAGYTTDKTNTSEPYAYETGYAVRRLINAQIDQLAGRKTDPMAGDLGPDRAPWIDWGPYLWANGSEPRSDGFRWRRSDYGEDGIQLSQMGRRKVSIQLMEYLKTSSTTSCWFLADRTCKVR